MNTPPSNAPHFEGKDVVEHLIEARAKGLNVSMEIHGLEVPGHFSAAADSLRDTLIALLLIHSIFVFTRPTFIAFSIGFLIWKTARSARLGWSRLERLHRLIEEERWEIEHHRSQEKEELRSLYEAKGLKGKLLDDVVEVLMADDNRLLKIMLEEELGLQLQSFEHPLRQSLGAFFGSLIASGFFLLALHIPVPYAPLGASLILLAIVSAWSAKKERNHIVRSTIWYLSSAMFAFGTAYFLLKVFK